MEVAFKVAVIVIAVSAMVSTISGLLILYKVKPWKF